MSEESTIKQMAQESSELKEEVGQVQLQFNSTPSTKKKSNHCLTLFFLTISLFLFVLFNLAFYSQSQQTTLLIIGTNSFEINLKSIQAFQKANQKYSYPCVLILKSNEFLSLQKYKTECRTFFVGSSETLDLNFLGVILKSIQTEYLFMMTTDWVLMDGSAVKQLQKKIQKSKLVSSVVVSHLKDSKQFTLFPALHRKQLLQSTILLSSALSSSSILQLQTHRKVKQYYSSKGFVTLTTKASNNSFLLQNQIEAQIKPQPAKKQEQTPIQNNKMPPISNPPEQTKINIPQKQPQKKPSKQLNLTFLRNNLVEASPIFEIEKLSSFKQLPFCLILIEAGSRKDIILSSISQLKYQNKKIVIPDMNHNYFSLKDQLRLQCPHNSYLMFINNPLESGSLRYLNQIHQKYSAWITYSKNQEGFQVFSVLFRVYELLEKNDFEKSKRYYLLSNNIAMQTLGLLELCLESNKLIEKNKIVKQNKFAYLNLQNSGLVDKDTTAYTKILRLNQDLIVPIQVLEKAKKKIPTFHPNRSLQLSPDNMLRAVDRQQERYLPENHSIYDLQFQDYNKKFNISQYFAIDKQVPFCVTMLSHNNIENDRYKKVIDSILHQNYSNFHIVFIDDVSTDQNMNMTIKYFKQKKFPKERVKFVQNKERNYATYNFVNAAFNFCNVNDIQMLIDGDDQFIGKYAFQVMNSAYQQDPELWVVYSNYKSTFYEYGRSARLRNDNQARFGTRRRYLSNIGVIRTWRVKLIHQIPPNHHKMRNGKWLDTLYDDAIQHPLFELASVRRIRYINEILYDYTVNYGGNDNASPEKHQYRLATYYYMASIPALSALSSLQVGPPNNQIVQQLEKDRNVRYQLLQIAF